ncbi:MAG: hypothetical protein ACQEVA_10080 [Myxococcota bacterium]
MSALLKKTFTWPCALMLSLSYGCAGVGVGSQTDPAITTPELTQDSADDEVHHAAQSWLLTRAFDHRDRALTDLPRSYPTADGPLAHQHYIYDAGLFLLWATWTGHEDAAHAVAAELMQRQSAEGRWPDALTVDDGAVTPSSSAPAGVAAWVAYALAYYDAALDEPRAADSARKTAEHLLESAITGPNGCGELVRSRLETDEIAVTEHQLDAVQLLHALGEHERASELLEDTVSCLWLDDEQRFATAATPHRVIERAAMDAAGGWGALSLAAAGLDSRASASLEYTVDTFATRGEDGLGFRPEPRAADDDGSEFIFFEGSLGVALAALRLGREAVADEALETARRAAIEHRGGVPYASKAAPNYSDVAAISSTIWFLFVDRELRLDQRAPVFNAAVPGSGAPGSSPRLDMRTR